MKNSTPFITPLYNIERNPYLLTISGLLSFLLVIITYLLFKQMNPLGFILIIPASFVCFQSLWFLLHPFALVYEDKIILKYSLFQTKEWYFIDVLKIAANKKGQLFITYKDGEQAKLNTFGIKPSQMEVLKKEIEKNIS